MSASAAGLPLDPSPEQMRAMAGTVAETVAGFIHGLDAAAASDLEGIGEAAARLREPAPRDGGDFDAVLAQALRAAEKGFNTAGPGYLAYIPGGGLFASALAEFLSYGLNRYVGVWNAAPGLAQLEATVIRWLADLFDLPPRARGILTTGGSLANFSAVVAARRDRLPEEFHHGVLYVSDQTHASVAKSAILAGFAAANVRAVATLPDLRMDPAALTAAVRADRAAGRLPFLVVGSAGTTNTGVVDPLGDLADVAGREGLWFHVDGAYGGFFQLTARGRDRLAGIERADSITLDPHKGLFLPYGTGCLLVRDGERLRAAHQVEAVYLQDLAPEDGIPNFADYSPELSRELRGLRVWLPLKLHGLRAFADALDEKLDLARILHEALAATPGFELPWAPELTVVAFRCRPPGHGDEEGFNRELLARINASHRVFLSSTMVGGRFFIRACVVSHRTHRDRIDEAVEIIRAAASDLAG